MQYSCAEKGKSNVFQCKKDHLSGRNNFGFAWVPLAIAAITAVGSIGGGYFAAKTARQQTQATAIQSQSAYQQMQMQLLMQQQQQKLEREKLLTYGILGGLALLVLKGGK